jgi:AraC-like DNA-binding protein
MSEATIPARKFLRLFDYLEHLELDVASIATSANLSPDRVAQLPEDEGLPAQQYSRLYKHAVAHMETLNQPIPWAAGVGGEAFELMCHCMISARTLGEALELATRFEALLLPRTGHQVSLVRDGDTAVLHYRVETDPNSALAPQHWDRADYQETVAKASGLLIWHALSGWLVGESLVVERVSISAPFLNEAYLDRLSSVFNCPVEFDAAQNNFSFSADQLERRTVHTSDSLREFLDNALYQLIVFDQEQASTSAAIKSLITLDLPTGLPSFTQISHHLHMSESSLRRRLQKENTSYQNLKDEVRCQVAIDKLVNEAIKVADLSDFLGFTEPSSFIRSFKNWTGETPRSYRDKMRALAVR